MRVLNPSLLHVVPAVLERITKSINAKLASNWFQNTLFQLSYEQKKKSYKAYKSTVILDKLIFKKISEKIVGKNISIILSAGALLSEEVQEFSQICLTDTLQAYGLTEVITCL